MRPAGNPARLRIERVSEAVQITRAEETPGDLSADSFEDITSGSYRIIATSDDHNNNNNDDDDNDNDAARGRF
jgi:hypothetical protein